MITFTVDATFDTDDGAFDVYTTPEKAEVLFRQLIMKACPLLRSNEVHVAVVVIDTHEKEGVL